MAKIINFPIHPEVSQQFIDKADKLQEQITEVRNLVGYIDPTEFKLVKEGLE